MLHSYVLQLSYGQNTRLLRPELIWPKVGGSKAGCLSHRGKASAVACLVDPKVQLTSCGREIIEGEVATVESERGGAPTNLI